MPGVDTNPLYLDWLGLAKGKPIPAELPRRAAAAWDGVLRFRILLQAVMRNKTDFQKSDSTYVECLKITQKCLIMQLNKYHYHLHFQIVAS